MVRRTMRTHRRQPIELIMPAALAQAEDLHEWRISNGGQYECAHGERCYAAKKRHARRRTAVSAVAGHGHHFPAPQRRYQGNGIGGGAGQRDHLKFLAGLRAVE